MFQRVLACHSPFFIYYTANTTSTLSTTTECRQTLRSIARHPTAISTCAPNRLVHLPYKQPTRPASCDPAFLVRHSTSAQVIVTTRPTAATTPSLRLVKRPTRPDRLPRCPDVRLPQLLLHPSIPFYLPHLLPHLYRPCGKIIDGLQYPSSAGLFQMRLD